MSYNVGVYSIFLCLCTFHDHAIFVSFYFFHVTNSGVLPFFIQINVFILKCNQFERPSLVSESLDDEIYVVFKIKIGVSYFSDWIFKKYFVHLNVQKFRHILFYANKYPISEWNKYLVLFLCILGNILTIHFLNFFIRHSKRSYHSQFESRKLSFN